MFFLTGRQSVESRGQRGGQEVNLLPVTFFFHPCYVPVRRCCMDANPPHRDESDPRKVHEHHCPSPKAPVMLWLKTYNVIPALKSKKDYESFSLFILINLTAKPLNECLMSSLALALWVKLQEEETGNMTQSSKSSNVSKLSVKKYVRLSHCISLEKCLASQATQSLPYLRYHS